jgi:nucleotide-binding universal stress UspA family protein
VGRVLVAVDEGETAQRVAEFVNRFFGDLDVDVLAVNVGRAPAAWIPPAVGWGGLYPWPYPYPDPRLADPGYLDRAQAEAELESERVVFDSKLKDAQTIVEFGDPAEAISRAATERNVDIIVIGTGDKNLLQRLVTPSVSRELAQHADRPVLIVH